MDLMGIGQRAQGTRASHDWRAVDCLHQKELGTGHSPPLVTVSSGTGHP
jgi:hypothetical protein